MNCPNCGQELKETDNFCTCCGRRLRVHPARQAQRAAHLQVTDAPASDPEPCSERDERRQPAPPEDQHDKHTPRPAVPAAQPASEPARHMAPSVRPDPEPTIRPPAPVDPVVDDPIPAAPPTPVPSPTPAYHPAPSPAPTDRPRASWGSKAALVFGVFASLLALAAAAILFVAPLAAVPFLGGSAGTSSEVIHAMLVSVDPQLSVFMSSLLNVGGLDALALASMAAEFSAAIGSTSLALGTGLALGFAIVAALLCLFGVLSSLVVRRATPVLILGSLTVALTGASLWMGTQVAGDALVSELRASLSAAFAAMGVQLPASAVVLEPTVWPLVVAVAGFVALVCALVSRCCARRVPKPFVEEL